MQIDQKAAVRDSSRAIQESASAVAFDPERSADSPNWLPRNGRSNERVTELEAPHGRRVATWADMGPEVAKVGVSAFLRLPYR